MWGASIALLALCITVSAGAHGPISPTAAATQAAVPAAFQVRGELPPQTGVTDLKFRDFFKLPIGPRGLEATPLLRSLDGQAVRIVGYMVRQEVEPAVPGVLVLAPLPVTLGDEDENYADDLPATTVYVHLAPAQAQRRLRHMPGLMAITGILQLGAQAEADGRRSMLRLLLDGNQSRALEKLNDTTP